MSHTAINKNTFSLLIKAVPDAIVIINSHGVIELVNSQTEKMFGYAAAELQGKEIEILIPDRYSKGHKNKRNSFIMHPETREMGSGLELFAKRKNGSEILVEIALNYLIEEEETYVFAAIRDMTEKKASEYKFKALLEAAPDAMVIANEQGLIELVNAQTEKLFGYHREELIGKEIEILIPQKFAIHHHKKKMNFIAAPEVREMGTGLELFALRKDGSEFEVEIALSYLKTATSINVCAAIRDISERKLLEKQKSFLASIVEHSNDAILSKNLKGEIISWNKGAETMFGYAANEVLGTQLRLISPQMFETKLTKILSGITPHTKEVILERKNGEKFPAAIAFSAIKDTVGNVVGISEIISDLTLLKQAHEKASVLDKKNKELEIKLAYHKQVEDFAYICSHNLRSPVGNLNSLFLMYNATQNEQEKELIIEKLKGVIAHLTSTLEEISKALSIQANKKIRKEKLVFEEVLLKQLEGLSADIEKTGAVIKYDFTKCTKISYPKIYLESIVLNFLTNSIKYRVPGKKPIITIETNETPENGKTFTIKDNGLGIDLKRYGKKIFGLHKTFHRNKDAKGVGLFITKAQIETLGGKIKVSSKPGKGTSFTVYFETK